jgi:hypothetical protein
VWENESGNEKGKARLAACRRLALACIAGIIAALVLTAVGYGLLTVGDGIRLLLTLLLENL